MTERTSLERLADCRYELITAKMNRDQALRDAINAGHGTNAIALASGLNRSTIYRQQQAGKLPRKDIP